MKIFRWLLLSCFLCSSAVFSSELLHTQITGVKGPALKNVTDRLAILLKSKGKEVTPQELADYYQHATSNIKAALAPYGYFEPVIQKKVTHAPAGAFVEFTIQLGTPVKIRHIELQLAGPGQDNKKIQTFRANLPIKSGQVFSTPVYDKCKEDLFQLASNEGYIKAELAQKIIRVNLKTHTADIFLKMDTGPRYYFGKISFGTSPFNLKFLKRFLTFHEDEPFNSNKLLELQQAMNNSTYFNNVTIDPALSKLKGIKVPVNIDMKVPKSQQYHMGLGYGTFTGPRLTLGTSLRRTTDSGQHFDAQIKLSPVLSGLATKYFIPGRNPLTDQFTIGANAQTFSPKNGYSYSETLAAGYVKNINLWQDTVSLSFLNERFKVATDSNPNVSSVSRLLYPTFIISRIHTDSVMNPTTGTAFTLTLQGASSHIVSSTSFVQAEIKTKYIFSPKTYGRFIFGMDFGYTIANNFEKLPLTLRYFAGGLGSIRGYPFSSIGPGRYLEILNFEYQHRIMNNISGAIFFDEGTATDHFNNKIFKSHGVGIIYSSFIGPIKFYVAQATSARRRPYRLEFSIGPDF